MKYTKAQAESIAKQIHQRFGGQIASVYSAVPRELLAGLIGVEAGKDRHGQLKEDARRFEPYVFERLREVRDGHRTSYNNIRRAQLKDTTDASLRALATSYGLTQIMGWWAIHLGCTVADLRSSDKHLDYAAQLIQRNALKHIESNPAAVFRIWNTGRANGRTHDPDYVYNAIAVMGTYRDLVDV